jgi:hypothetical protein
MSVVFEPVNGSEPPTEELSLGAVDEAGVVELWPVSVAATVAGAVVVVVVVEPVDAAELVTTGGVAMLVPVLSTNCIRNMHVLPTPQS